MRAPIDYSVGSRAFATAGAVIGSGSGRTGGPDLAVALETRETKRKLQYAV